LGKKFLVTAARRPDQPQGLPRLPRGWRFAAVFLDVRLARRAAWCSLAHRGAGPGKWAISAGATFLQIGGAA
jgi:hypothetical protein